MKAIDNTVSAYFSDLMQELQVDPSIQRAAPATLSRRNFIKLSGLLGGGLALGFVLKSPSVSADEQSAESVELSS